MTNPSECEVINPPGYTLLDDSLRDGSHLLDNAALDIYRDFRDRNQAEYFNNVELYVIPDQPGIPSEPLKPIPPKRTVTDSVDPEKETEIVRDPQEKYRGPLIFVAVGFVVLVLVFAIMKKG